MDILPPSSKRCYSEGYLYLSLHFVIPRDISTLSLYFVIPRDISTLSLYFVIPRDISTLPLHAVIPRTYLYKFQLKFLSEESLHSTVSAVVDVCGYLKISTSEVYERL